MSDFLGYQQHPIATKFPLLSGKDFEVLCKSMREVGFDASQPIVLLEGAILDGRNRLRAAKEVGIDPVFREWAGEMGSPVVYALQTNLARRHLTLNERAFLVMDEEIVDMLAEEAKVRKKSQGGDRRSPNRRRGPLGAPMPQAKDEGRTAEKLAKVAKVSARTMKHAKAIVDHAPDLKDEVLAGRKSMAKAAKEAVTRKRTPPRVDVDNVEVEIRKRIDNLATALRNSWPKHHALIAKCLREAAKP